MYLNLSRLRTRHPVSGGISALISYSKGEKLFSVLVVAMLIATSFAIVGVSDNAQALEFVESIPVPWPSTFTPIDTAWDTTGNHAMVVGNDTSGQSNAWHYNSASEEWGQVEGVIVTSQTYYVGFGAGNYSTIQAAIDVASPGDTVYVWSGSYSEHVVVNKAINLTGESRLTTEINGYNAGIPLRITANWVNVTGFTITGSAPTGIGVNMNNAHNSIFTRNIVEANYCGILMSGACDNFITRNQISSNGNDGIFLGDGSNNNVIRLNDISINNYGISIDSGDGNKIYHNNIMGNANQAYDFGVNTWNMALVDEGNYWDDWTSPDVDGNGIVDIPYSVSGGGQDNFPWAMQDGWNVENISLVGDWHFDEGSGQTTADASGNGNNGQLGSVPLVDGFDPTWTTGVSGAALDYTNDYVRVAHSNSLNLGQYFSMEGWVEEPDFSAKLLDHYTTTTNVAVQNQVVVTTANPGEVRLGTFASSFTRGPNPAMIVEGGGWTNPNLANDASNNAYASYASTNSATQIAVSLSPDGSSYTPVQIINLINNIDTLYPPLGGNGQLWGRAWAPSEFDNANFHFRMSTNGISQDYTAFNFALPANAIIDGIEVSLEGYYTSVLFTYTRYVDFFTVKIYYHTNSYYTLGELISTNILPSYGGLVAFETSATSIPAVTGLYMLFSKDNVNWYNSAGVFNVWQSIPVGYNSVTLSALDPIPGSAFYYKVRFTSDGTATPVLDWINVTYESTTLTAPILSKFNSYELRVSSQMVYGRLYQGGTWVEVSAGITWQTGWNYFAFTSAGPIKSLYFNGVSVRTSVIAGGPSISTYPLYFGSYNAIFPYLIAKIDEVKLWNRTITSQDVQDRYDELTMILIHNVVELQAMNNDMDAIYALANDIDASATSGWNGGAGFMPIGSIALFFTGKLDGQGYTVTGLCINRPGTDYVGLFGVIGSACTVKNVNLVNVNVIGNYGVGSLVGYSNGAAVSYSSTSGTVTGMSDVVGGLVGMNSGGTVFHSNSSATVSGSGTDTGGLVGYMDWLSVVSNSYATGDVYGDQSVGGLVGENCQGTIEESYSSGDVSGNNNVGGLLGYIIYSESSVIDSYSTGVVSGTTFAGGLIGDYSGGTVTNSYWDLDSSGMATSAAGTGLNTAQMKTEAEFTSVGWDFTNTWHMLETVTYPLFQWQPLPMKIIFQPFTGVAWDNINKRFWICGETDPEAPSTVYYIEQNAMTTLVPLSAPTLSFQTIAADNIGGIMVAGNGLPAIYYWDGVSGHTISEATVVSMAGWNITGITFNTIDSRFYLVGNVKNQDKGAAFFTDQLPLTGASKCYQDMSDLMQLPGIGGLNSIEWNPSKHYGMAVGSGVYSAMQYDGNAFNKLNWTVIKSPEAGKSYHDISWDRGGWNEAAIVGQNGSFGSYWRYYDSNPILIPGQQNSTVGTKYLTCAMKPPSSPKWLIVPASNGILKINIEEKYEGGEIIINLAAKPNIIDVQMFMATDTDKLDLFNLPVDAGTAYTFFIEANYTLNWNDLNISITAWHDRNTFGSLSQPGALDGKNRTRQFNLTYMPATNTTVMHYPLPENGVSEFYVKAAWNDSGYGPDGSWHRVYIKVYFGNQTTAAIGAMNQATNTNDPNMALNDINTWDLCVHIYDRNDLSSSNKSYEEFGIKEYATITTTGTPGGSAPPGATNIHLSSSYINYSTNTNHSVTISIPNIHLNGDPGISFNITADRLVIQNMNATAEYSDISTQLSFSGPNSPLYIWGKSVGPILIAAPYNGTRSMGPLTDHHSPGFMACTVLDWWLTEVPAGLPNGVYLGTITLTLDH